jgi:hypothetical protein
VGAQQNLDAVVLEDRKPQPVLSLRATVRIDELAERHGESLRELWRSMQTRGVAAAGSPFVRYHTFGPTETDVEVGTPIADAVSGEGRITAGELPGAPQSAPGTSAHPIGSAKPTAASKRG